MLMLKLFDNLKMLICVLNVSVEVLGALVSVSVIWGITVTLFYESIKRLSYPDSFEVNPEIMLITACIGVFVNIL